MIRVDTSFIIPVYNAADIVENCAEQIEGIMAPLGVPYEILFCNDGSGDMSRPVLERLCLQQPKVKVFHNSSNRGLGFTLNRLLKEAGGERVVYCDCDLPFGAGIMPFLLNKLDFNDIVVASRYLGASNEVPLRRKVCSRLYYFLCKGLFNIPVSDIGSGTVAMRRCAVEGINLKAQGFDVHAEFYLEAAEKGMKIEEMPIRSKGTGQASFCIWRHGFQTLLKTSQLYFRLRGRRC